MLGQIGDVTEAADVLEQQFEAFTDRPDLRGQTEAALANVTRIDPATRHRAAGTIGRMRRRIAELAAAGQQNREIAEALFVTMATVEFHLRNAYRKLGISSRTQLANALGA